MVVASYVGAYDKDEDTYNVQGVMRQVARLRRESDAAVQLVEEAGLELQQVNDEILQTREALETLVQKQANLRLARHQNNLEIEYINEKAQVIQDILDGINGNGEAIQRTKNLKRRWAALGLDPHEIGFKLGGHGHLRRVQRGLEDRRQRALEQRYMRVRVPPARRSTGNTTLRKARWWTNTTSPRGALPRLERQFGQRADVVYRDLGVGGQGQRLQQELYQAPTVHVMFT